MHEKFNDASKASCYVESGLLADYPDHEVEVIFTQGAEQRSRVCAGREAGHTLNRFCAEFPRASVYYDAGVKEGVVAVIRCHCEQGRRMTCCDHGPQRPRVLVMVRKAPAPAVVTDEKGKDKGLFLSQSKGAKAVSLTEDAGKSHPAKHGSLRDQWR